ncbi:MAG TPA: GGDEF domain-containing protein [Acidimicrobiia bacterium]|nr:GGDEF domain-containing protein [Acidimicrobiia bacterium]
MFAPKVMAKDSSFGILSWRAARVIAVAVSVVVGITVIVQALLTPHLTNSWAPIVTGAAAIVMGVVVLPFLPWEHWPYRCVVAAVLTGFALNAVDRSFSPTRGTFGATVMTVFIGVGFVSTRKQMSALAVPMLAAILTPYFVNANSGVSFGEVLFVVAGGLLCGYATAYFSERLLQSEQLAADRLKVLEEIVEAGLVLNGSEEDGIANTVVDIARRLLSVDRVALLVRDGDELVFANQAGWSAFPQKTRVSVDDWAQFRGAIPVHGPHGVAALLVVPDNARVGLDDDLVGALVTQIGVAIHRETSLAYLRDAALLDPLTGVGNRRHADALFASLNGGDAVVILDLDHFKDLNDRLGHTAGDAALRDFGRMLAEEIRASDQVARLGGEEFLVVLRNAGEEQVTAACERLRKRWDGRFSVTFSAGAAWYVPGESHEQTFAVADSALYRAKNAGRDRTELVLNR